MLQVTDFSLLLVSQVPEIEDLRICLGSRIIKVFNFKVQSLILGLKREELLLLLFYPFVSIVQHLILNEGTH